MSLGWITPEDDENCANLNLPQTCGTLSKPSDPWHPDGSIFLRKQKLTRTVASPVLWNGKQKLVYILQQRLTKNIATLNGKIRSLNETVERVCRSEESASAPNSVFLRAADAFEGACFVPKH